MAETRVGFIGLGRMGRPMAGHIANAGFSLVVLDADPNAAAETASETAGSVAEDAAALAGACEIVVTMLPNGSIVRNVALGTDTSPGLVDGFSPGSILIDMSSSAPSGTAALAEDLETRGFHLIDAPVSGGQSRAVEGTLSLMVGGADDVIDRCMPILEPMSSGIFRTGKPGTGHAMKALNNMLSACGLLAAAEVLATGQKFGLDPGIMLEVLNASTGMNHATQNKYRQFVLPRSFGSKFAMDLMVKDLDTAMGVARETETPVPFLSLCREISATALANLEDVQDPDGPDHTELARWVEQLTGADLTGRN